MWMSENPFQLLFQAFGKVSECVQTHLSHFILQPSPSLSHTTNHTPLLSPDSNLLQPAEILKKGKSSGPTTKEELGRATWTFLHTLAAQVFCSYASLVSNFCCSIMGDWALLNRSFLDKDVNNLQLVVYVQFYPDKPTRQQKKDVKELMAILSRMYPCKECADHFKEVLRANPVQVGSHDEFSQWLCHTHNVVNRSLGKVIFPCERVDARWGKLECEQRACDLQGTSMDFGQEGK
ncbi:hypothetical protein BUALT_Bualt05G0008000 [Buddleja alternifolia]|uniref:Sulfhydryl oxidase n=1 Tax=Buddleja alternifolia TaxID=168488 RepID=A0AAV6XHC9_9LAMI|nr:hypothetical protein BUALT_Bualt05G0008000 [Buddleja alternifolia]